MKQYIVKVTYTANEKNRGFAGQQDIWYRGKNGDSDKQTTLFEMGILEGWKRRHFAEMHIKNDNPEYFWDKEYEVIEIDVK